MEYINFNLTRPYNSKPAEGPVYWLTHPCYRDWCDPERWSEVVDFIADFGGTLIVAQNELGISYEINIHGSIDKLKSEDRIHFGWWNILQVVWSKYLDVLQEKYHIVFGQMIDECEMDLVKHLLGFIPSCKIQVLRHYSFSNNPEDNVEESIKFYTRNGVNILDGDILELEKHLI